MKSVLKAIHKRVQDEVSQIHRLESDILVYEKVIESGEIYPKNHIGNCDKCGKLVYLDHGLINNVDCDISCIDCRPKRCSICDVFHVEEGVEEWRHRQRTKRRKKRRIILG